MIPRIALARVIYIDGSDFTEEVDSLCSLFSCSNTRWFGSTEREMDFAAKGRAVDMQHSSLYLINITKGFGKVFSICLLYTSDAADE